RSRERGSFAHARRPSGAPAAKPWGEPGPRRSGSALAHAHVLGLLEDLALGDDRRGDHHLRVLELGDVARAAHTERGAKRPGEVLAPVVNTGRAEEDLAQRRLGPDVDPGATRKVRVR